MLACASETAASKMSARTLESSTSRKEVEADEQMKQFRGSNDIFDKQGKQLVVSVYLINFPKNLLKTILENYSEKHRYLQ